MANWPEIQIDKEVGCVVAHNEDGSKKMSNTMESLILAKILFRLEIIDLRLEGKLKPD